MARDITRAELAGLIDQHLGKSDWRLIDQSMIEQFADLTDDRQWIHVDTARAAREVGGTIAHGFLTMAMLSALQAEVWRMPEATRAINYGFNKIRFVNVVRPGQRIRLSETLRTVETRENSVILTRDIEIEIEGEERPALVGQWLALFAFD